MNLKKFVCYNTMNHFQRQLQTRNIVLQNSTQLLLVSKNIKAGLLHDDGVDKIILINISWP